MKNMTFSLAVIASVLLLSSSAFAGSGWMDNIEKAKKKAKEENKLLLMDFTGSDWCGWCIKLDKEVFSQREFKKYAKANLILMEVDFPKGKKLKKKLREQNDALKKEYGITGYPTIVVLDSDGNKVGKLGYMKGGPEPFIAELEKLKSSTGM